MAKKETSADVLEQLSCTYLAIDELNKAIPRLNEDIEKSSELASEAQTKCQEVKELLSTAEDKASAFSEEASVGIEKIQKNVKTVQTIQSNIKKMIKDLPDFDELKNTISSLSDHIDELEDELDENLIRLEEEFNKRIEQIEQQLSKLNSDDWISSPDDIEIPNDLYFDLNQDSDDVKEYYSIQELYDENEEYPLVVVASTWHGDYCFQVDGIVNGFAYGVNYKNGKLQPISSRRRKEKASEKRFRLYDQKYLDKIKKNAYDEDFRTFLVNRGFLKNDEPFQGSHKHLSDLESDSKLSPWAKIAKQLFNFE